MPIDETTTLPDGLHLRVRLPQASDRAGLLALHERLGLGAEELDAARALHFDPRRRTVACATAWVEGAELLVAYGAMDAGARDVDVLLADEARAPGAGAVLARALRERSARRAAA
jgi:hypothetical protein